MFAQKVAQRRSLMSGEGSCTVCRHTKVEKIEALLVSAQQSIRALERRFGVSRQSLARHRDKHIPQALERAAQRAAEKREDGLLGSYEELVLDAKRIGRKAELAGDLPTALQAIRELTRLVELAVVHQPKPAKKLSVNFFFRQGRVVAQEVEEPIETTAAAVETLAPPPAPQPEAPPPPAPDEPPEPPESPVEPMLGAVPPPAHVCTARCTPFNCVVKNEAAEDANAGLKHRRWPGGWEYY
jgi:hypothetical protein